MKSKYWEKQVFTARDNGTLFKICLGCKKKAERKDILCQDCWHKLVLTEQSMPEGSDLGEVWDKFIDSF